jgi:division protein 1
MAPRIASAISSRQRTRVPDSSNRLDFASIGRAPLRLTLGPHRVTSRDLQIIEAAEELLEAEIPEPDGIVTNVSLLRGFNATIPSADQNRARRRQMRSVTTPRLGLKRLGMTARGLITEDSDVGSEEDVVLVSASESVRKGKKRGRESLSTAKKLGRDELNRQEAEIARDKENIYVRRVCARSLSKSVI